MTRSSRRLLVLSPAFHGYWASIGRAFTAAGYDVATVTYDAPGRLGRVAVKVGHDLPSRFGMDLGVQERHHTRSAVEAVREHDPEILLVVKGDTFGPQLWDLLDARRQRRALWLYDELRRTRHTDATLRAAGPIASYSTLDVAALERGGHRAVHVPLAFDPAIPFRPVAADEVTFVGARYPNREALLTGLLTRDLPVRAYGRDWSGHPWDRLRTWRVSRPRVPSGRDLSRGAAYGVMAGSRATMNIHGDQDGFTMRTFEAGGVGSVQLIDRADVQGLYEPDVELAVFSGVDEAADLARRAATDRPWSDGLREAGRRRTLAEHTFAHRVAVLESLWAA